LEQKFSASIYNYSFWIEYISIPEFKIKLENIIIESGHTIRNFSEEWFSELEHSCVWILGESHFASHSFKKESNAIYCELSSCSETKYKNFINNIKKSALKLIKEFIINKSL